MTTKQTTTAVFTRLTAADLKLLRAEARRKGTTGSQIIRELTEAHLTTVREDRKASRGAAKKARA